MTTVVTMTHFFATVGFGSCVLGVLIFLSKLVKLFDEQAILKYRMDDLSERLVNLTTLYTGLRKLKPAKRGRR